MSELPRWCAKEGCLNPRPKLIKEHEDWWSLGCETCRRVAVITKPKTKARARLEVEAQRLGKFKHSWDRPVIFSFSKKHR